LRSEAPQDGSQATRRGRQVVELSVLRGRQVVEPGDQAAAVGDPEGERDDLAGEQRVDEPAGAALAGVRSPRGVEAVALGDGAQGRFVLGRQGPYVALLSAWAC